MQFWERLGQELAVLLSVLAWGMLRAGGAIVKRVSQGKDLQVDLFGKEIVHIKQSKGNLTQQAKEKTKVIKELDLQKTTDLTSSRGTAKLVLFL